MFETCHLVSAWSGNLLFVKLTEVVEMNSREIFFFKAFFLSNFGNFKMSTKGQLISKYLFGVFSFFRKTNENTSDSIRNK